MITNYEKDEYGVIHQIEQVPFNYTPQYVSYYDNDERAALSKQMAHLRYGYIKGSIGKFNSVLDVGFGNGDFLSVASNEVDTGGYDVFENLCLPDKSKFVDDIFKDEWDVVTFFDSYEHMKDISILNRIKTKYLVISLPWCHYVSDDWFKNWKHRKPNEHLHHFDLNSLVQYVTAQGYSYVTHSNIEDIIRKPVDGLPNILTTVFKN